MKRVRTTPSYRGLAPSSNAASTTAKRSSVKRDTAPEMLLRRALWARGVRYRVDAGDLPGRPDLALYGARVAVFCDGDFWHGRDLDRRVAKLRRGHNAAYWTAKIAANRARDHRNDAILKEAGWEVLRFWERDLVRDADAAASLVIHVLHQRRLRPGLRTRTHEESLS